MKATTVESERRVTSMGTPCARSWGEEWIARVEAREAEVGRRICGARTVGGHPCSLPSEHVSGRCLHHGGAELVGAPEGNRNAVVHGLYSRRLMICGTHCPAWQSCPMGGGASTFSLGKEKVEPKETGKNSTGVGGAGFQPAGVPGAATMADPRSSAPGSAGDSRLRGNDNGGGNESGGASTAHGDPTRTNAHGRTGRATKPGAHASTPGAHGVKGEAPLTYGQYLMRLPASERPLCPYEQAEYNAVVTDVELRTGARSVNPLGAHLAHTIALVSVMVSRATRALAMKPFTEKLEHSGDTFYMSMERPSAAFTALRVLSCELRQWMRHLERNYPHRLTLEAVQQYRERRARDTSHDPDAEIEQKATKETKSERGLGGSPLREAPWGSRCRARAEFVDDIEDECTESDLGEEWEELQRDIAELDAHWDTLDLLPENHPEALAAEAHGRAAHATKPTTPATNSVARSTTVPQTATQADGVAADAGGAGAPLGRSGNSGAGFQPAGVRGAALLDAARTGLIQTLKAIYAKRSKSDPSNPSDPWPLLSSATTVPDASALAFGSGGDSRLRGNDRTGGNENGDRDDNRGGHDVPDENDNRGGNDNWGGHDVPDENDNRGGNDNGGGPAP